jgi:hypothetical protein
MAALAAVVLIPVGIAGTSYLLSEDPMTPSVPADVELEEPAPPPKPPNEEVVPQPSATEDPLDDPTWHRPHDDEGGEYGDDADEYDDDGPDDD